MVTRRSAVPFGMALLTFIIFVYYHLFILEREEFMEVQWYPGHMTKARRMMEENIRLVDLVIELVDARIPLSSSNPDIDALCRGKGRVVLLCKADLADPAATEQFVEYYRERGIIASAVDARERKAADLVRRQIQEACREKIERDRARGIVGRPLRAMVAGIPNVGKSTFINSFAGRASAKTGNKPGVTRGKQWIRIGEGVELLDTPGILWPKFDSREIGMRLALIGAVRDEILDKEELALWLLKFLESEYPGTVRDKYLGTSEACSGDVINGDVINKESAGNSVDGISGGDENQDDDEIPKVISAAGTVPEGYALLVKIARSRLLLLKGAEPDTSRAAAMLIDDCKNGRLGRISLDRPQDAQAMRESYERARKAAVSRADASSKGASGKRPSSSAAGKGRKGRRKDDPQPSRAERDRRKR